MFTALSTLSLPVSIKLRLTPAMSLALAPARNKSLIDASGIRVLLIVVKVDAGTPTLAMSTRSDPEYPAVVKLATCSGV